MRWARNLMREPLAALREVFHNANLRRVQLAFMGSVTGQYAFSIAISVYAYEHGGAKTVGLVMVARNLPAALVAPFAAIVADRGRRERVMLACDIGRAAAVGGAAAIVAAGGPPLAVYALGVAVTMMMTTFHPAEAALLPLLARSPEELAASNVSSSSIEGIGGFAGPALGGLFLAAFSIEAAFLFVAATFLWSAVLVARIRLDQPEPAAEPEKHSPEPFRREALAGFRILASEPKLRVVVGLYAAQTIVAGGASVLTVVAAIRLLGLGNGGVGYLNAATGVGGLAGAVVVLARVSGTKIAGDFGLGIVLWEALLLIGIEPKAAIAFVLIAILGLGNTLVDVSALTLLQRSVDNAVLARVFGVVQALLVGSMALGALIAPALIAAFGIRAALIATGAFLPILAALRWARLAAIDREARIPTRRLELLRAIPLFDPLPAGTLEWLAQAMKEVTVTAGTDVVREGDPGEEFYVLAAGSAEVLVDGAVKPIEAGDYFGEIALLRSVPRTATVRAVTDLELLTLDRAEFIGAVTGHPASRDAADAVIGARLGSLRTGTVPA